MTTSSGKVSNPRVKRRRHDPAAVLRDTRYGPLPGLYTTRGTAIANARRRNLLTQAELGRDPRIQLTQATVAHLEGGGFYLNQHMAEVLALVLTGDATGWQRFVGPAVEVADDDDETATEAVSA